MKGHFLTGLSIVAGFPTIRVVAGAGGGFAGWHWPHCANEDAPEANTLFGMA